MPSASQARRLPRQLIAHPDGTARNDCHESWCWYRVASFFPQRARNVLRLSWKSASKVFGSSDVEPCSRWMSVTAPQTTVRKPASFARRQKSVSSKYERKFSESPPILV